ncbi:hypothetical protein DEJ44_11810 [Streptomyces venezuelae]|nr:hypothetical protein DEJ44_11810 [Streptomyces venezuelae]
MPDVPYRRPYGGQTDVAESDRNVPLLVATGPAHRRRETARARTIDRRRPDLRHPRHRPRRQALRAPWPPPGARPLTGGADGPGPGGGAGSEGDGTGGRGRAGRGGRRGGCGRPGG